MGGKDSTAVALVLACEGLLTWRFAAALAEW